MDSSFQNCILEHRNSAPPKTEDVFAHVWYDKSWVGEYFWDQYKDRGRWDADLIPFMEENWKPKALEFEEPKEFENVINTNLIANFRILRSLEMCLRNSKNAKLCVISSKLTKDPKPFFFA